MSKIYNESGIFCPKSNDHNSLDGYSLNTVTHLSQLLFCPSCQYHKSKNDCYYNIECKFCSNCITDYSSSPNDTRHCSKNCFVCPDCTAPLTISISDHDVNGKTGKSFKFSCVCCEYNYETKVITSPKSLHSIISSERKAASVNLFQEYHDKLTSDQTTDDSNEMRMKNLALSNLKPKAKEISRNISNQPESSSPVRYPLAQKLSTKKSYRCLKCNSFLLLPHIEPGQLPTVNKFRVKFNAVDYMPSLKFTDTVSNKILQPDPPVAERILRVGESKTFLINFINPLPSEMNVHIATVPFIPSNMVTPASNTGNSSNYKIQLTLPVADIAIKSTEGTKNLIKTIPTACLTTKSTISRSELILRMGNALFQSQDNATPEPSSSLESLAVQGQGWSQLPLSLSLELSEKETTFINTEEPYDIRIPLFITVSAELPDSIKSLNLTKKELSYGYWNIIDLSNYKFSI